MMPIEDKAFLSKEEHNSPSPGVFGGSKEIKSVKPFWKLLRAVGPLYYSLPTFSFSICTEHLQVQRHEAITARKIDGRDLALPSKTGHPLGEVRYSGERLQSKESGVSVNAESNKIHKIMSSANRD